MESSRSSARTALPGSSGVQNTVAAGRRSNSGLPDDAIALVRYHDAVRLYVQQDANFNVTAVTDSAGMVLERYVYEPYGSFTVLNADWSADEDGQSDYGQLHLHQGGRHDAVSGLYHFRNRDYSPSLGRWVQPDHIGQYVDGMSLYQAYSGNSVGRLDASGLFSGDNHIEITREAFFFSAFHYKNRSQSSIAAANRNTDPSFLFTAGYHAQDISFVPLVKDLMAEMKKLDASTWFKRLIFSKQRAFTLVGETMHILQDVYAHTDWVEGREMIPVYRKYLSEKLPYTYKGMNRRWSDQGEADLIKKADKNEPHGAGVFSLEKLASGDASEFASTIFYDGGLTWWGRESKHNRYGADSQNKGRASKDYGLGSQAFDDAKEGGVAITGELLKWMEKNIEPCALRIIKN